MQMNLEPSDVTDLREGQSSRISLLSYDFTIYGTISGFISEIAQNTSENDSEKSIMRPGLKVVT